MEKQIIHKGRIRNFIGRLQSFSDLPIKNQDELKEIKKFLLKKININIDLYLFGSFYHGFADNESDYDIIVSERADFNTLDALIKEELGYQVNLSFYNDKISEIIIP